MLDWKFDEQFNTIDSGIICGVDEAGRGPLAGPVYAAAVVLPHKNCEILLNGLDDSKKLSAKTRERLFTAITETALDYAIARAEVEEIECLNILNASMLAMRRAISMLKTNPNFALVDGNIVREFPIKARPIIGGDSISPSIAAASILAKVTRDRYCEEMDILYPQYGFKKNKGYGTAEHRTAILEYGPSPIHRESFLKKLYKKS